MSTNSTYYTVKRGRGGFSLIELMAAISILMVIVVLMGMIFAASNDSWRTGSDKAENNTLGRGAISKMAEDLEYAVADEILTFRINPAARPQQSSYGVENDEICFVSLVNDSADDNRTAREVFYYVRPSTERSGTYDLVMSVYDNELVDMPEQHCYQRRDWFNTRPAESEAQFVAENVASLAFHATYTNRAGALVTARDYDSTGSLSSDQLDQLPLYVDIYLEIIDGTAARQIAGRLDSGAVGETDAWTQLFVERNLKRYTKRVYFKNRDGYRKRIH